MTNLVEAQSIDDVRQHVIESKRVRATSGGTKSALSRNATISLAKMSGMLEYNPSEYTFTALSGTPLSQIESMLAENKQFMPFDPPLIEQGATIGGTVAAGLSGPARFRFGGIRDFFLGVQLVTGTGRVVFGGGKVVKNAAGFDFPKLLVGSFGSLAVMTELTFKVFPVPEAYRTLRIKAASMAAAVEVMKRMSLSPIELHCLDIDQHGNVIARTGGLATAVGERAKRLQAFAEGEGSVEILADEQETQLWQDARNMRWVGSDQHLVKLPLTPDIIPHLEAALDETSLTISRRYSVGGNLAWLGWPQAAGFDELSSICEKLQRAAMVLTGDCQNPIIDPRPKSPLLERLLTEFDPEGKFSS